MYKSRKIFVKRMLKGVSKFIEKIHLIQQIKKTFGRQGQRFFMIEKALYYSYIILLSINFEFMSLATAMYDGVNLTLSPTLYLHCLSFSTGPRS